MRVPEGAEDLRVIGRAARGGGSPRSSRPIALAEAIPRLEAGRLIPGQRYPF